MKKQSILVAAMITLVSGTAYAQSDQSSMSVKNGIVTTHQFVNTRSGEKEVSCSSFTGLEDKFKPQAVSYAIGYNRAKRPDDAIVDVSGVDSIMPIVVSTCMTTPALPLHQAVANSLRK